MLKSARYKAGQSGLGILLHSARGFSFALATSRDSCLYVVLLLYSVLCKLLLLSQALLLVDLSDYL